MTLEMPHLVSFYWCFDLRYGSLLVGLLHLAVSIAFTTLSSMFADEVRGYVGTIEDSEDHVYSAWFGVAATVAVVGAAHVLLAATLLYSAFKRIITGLRLWLWTMSIIYMVVTIILFVDICLTGFPDFGFEEFISLAAKLLFFTHLGYCIMCVYSFYLMLRSIRRKELNPY